MKSLKIAVPTNNPGGIGATRSEHFGHCDVFTIIDLEDGKVSAVGTLANVEHGAGGCMVPVQLLKNSDVDALVVGGMGMRPLLGFNQVGIEVYFAHHQEYLDVESVISGFLQDKLVIMQPQQTCQGGGDCHH